MPLLLLSALAAVLASQFLAAQSIPWRDPSPHHAHRVTVEPGVQLEVLDWGGIGEPLIFLPGLGSTSHSFDNFAPRIRDAVHVYGITRRGFGASSQPEAGYDAATRARDILAVLDTFGIERAILVGHSIAGDELSAFAVAYPHRVRALVYLEAYDYGNGLAEAFRATPGPRSPPMLPGDSASVQSLRAFLARRSGIAPPEAEVRASNRFSETGRWEGPVTPGRIGASVLSGVAPSEYSRIRAPALAIYALWETPAQMWPRYASFDAENRALADGSFAALVPRLRVVQERFRSQMSQGHVVMIAGGQHGVHVSHPAEVEGAIREFLRRTVLTARH
jgi:pimeloyl-ACP methyl ester carboxylesterase